MERMPDKETVEKIANLFKAFADPTRVQILSNLVGGELYVSDITDALALTQSAVSHQLSILKQMDLVKARREGKSCFYSLADDHVKTILKMGLEHVNE